MLQRALAALLCLLGAAAVGLAVASATVWRASDTLEASATAASGSTLLVTAPGVLEMAADEVSVEAAGDGVVIALGTTADVEAWVGADAHTVVTGLSDLTTLSTTEVPAAEPADGEATEEPAEGEAAEGEATEEPAEGEAAEGEATEATPAPNPAGSDLWVQEVTGESTAQLSWQAEPGRWSLLVASTAESAGPPEVTLRWPQEVTTPWLVPGVAVGSLLLLVGAGWLALLLVRGRRARRREELAVTPEGAVTTPAAGSRLAGVGAAGVAVGAAQPPAGQADAGQTTAGQPGAAPPGVPLTRRQMRELERTGQLPTVAAPVPPVDAPGDASAEQVSAAAPSPGASAGTPAPTTGDAEPPSGPEEVAAAGPARGAGVVPAAGRHAPPTRGRHAPPERQPVVATLPAANPTGTTRPAAPPTPAPSTPSTADGDPAARTAAGADAPALPLPPAPEDEPEVAPAFSARLASRFTRRRRPEQDAAVTPEPPAEQVPEPEAPPVWTPRPGQHGQSASADAWRKAWGFTPPEPGGDEPGRTDETEQDGGAR